MSIIKVGIIIHNVMSRPMLYGMMEFATANERAEEFALIWVNRKAQEWIDEHVRIAHQCGGSFIISESAKLPFLSVRQDMHISANDGENSFTAAVDMQTLRRWHNEGPHDSDFINFPQYKGPTARAILEVNDNYNDGLLTKQECLINFANVAHSDRYGVPNHLIYKLLRHDDWSKLVNWAVKTEAERLAEAAN